MRLEFGRPQDPLQATFRLPDKVHPEYKIDGGPFEHLAHLKKVLLETIGKILIGQEIPLEERYVPLEIEDMKLLKQASSFICSQESILTAEWNALSEKSAWAEYFPSGDHGYRWWQVSQMKPALGISGYEIFCVETNDQFEQETHFNQNSAFDIFILTPEEIKSLKKDLIRGG